MRRHIDVKKTMSLALLTAVGLILFTIESYIPFLTAIPGVKLGLANVVTVYVLYRYPVKDALIVSLARVLLGAMFAGQVMSLLYSLSGSALSIAGMLMLKKLAGNARVWTVSAIGGVLHNAGQLLCALLVTGTKEILAYMPVLVLSGILAGAFTGLAAGFVLDRMEKIRNADGRTGD